MIRKEKGYDVYTSQRPVPVVEFDFADGGTLTLYGLTPDQAGQAEEIAKKVRDFLRAVEEENIREAA